MIAKTGDKIKSLGRSAQQKMCDKAEVKNPFIFCSLFLYKILYTEDLFKKIFLITQNFLIIGDFLI